MRVGHYMHDLWGLGGVATYLRRITAAQRDGGHEIVFFDSAGSPSGLSGRNAVAGAVRVRDGRDLVAAARREAVDVLHLHRGPPGGFPGGVPAVQTVHGHQPYCPSGSQYLERRTMPCERRCSVLGCTWGHVVDRCGSVRPRRFVDDFRRTAAERRAPGTMPLIAISRFVRDRLVREGFDPARIRVLSNPAASTADVAQIGGEARFAFLGRIVPAKGVSWLLDAAAAANGGWKLDVAGTGYADAAVRARTHRLGLDDRVTFHGWLEESAATDLIRTAWAVVVPSMWHEPAGLSAIDAGAFGRAVVASSAGGLPEVIEDGVTGILAPPGDVRGLAGALDRLANDRATAERMGVAGAHRVARRHALADHLHVLEDAYAQAMTP